MSKKEHTFKGTLGWWWLDNRHPIGYVGPFLTERMALVDWKNYNASFPTLKERRNTAKASLPDIKSIQKSA